MTDPKRAHRSQESETTLARIEGLVPAIRKSFVSSVLSISIFGTLLFPQSPTGLAIWVAIRLVISVASVLVLRRLAVAQRGPDETIRTLTGLMAVSGVVWGLIPLLVQPAAPEWRAVVVLWLFGNQSVVTAVCAPSRQVFRAAIGTVTLVGAVSSAIYGDSFGLVLAALLILGGAYSHSIFGAMHQSVNAAIEARLVAFTLATSLTVEQQKLEAANEALAQLASCDELTGLVNRRTFIDHLVDDEGRLTADGWLSYLDIDLFKAVNDTYGHAAGDQVLQIASSRWQKVLAASGVLARTGGDEFAAWFDVSSDREARQLGERLNRCLALPIAIPDQPPFQVSCSIGITQAWAGESFAVAAARADRSLYIVKGRGRNGIDLASRRDADAAADRV